MNLAEKTILNILAKSSGAVFLLCSSVVMVRYFPKDEYGTFLQIMLIVNTTVMFTSVGLPHSIYYFFPQVLNRKHFVIRNVIMSLTIAAIAALIAYGFKSQLASWLNNPLLIEFGWIVSLLILFRGPSLFQEPMLVSHGSLILNSLLTLLDSTIFFVPLIIAAFLSVSLTTLLYVMSITAGIGWFIFLLTMGWLIFRVREPKSADYDPKASKHTFSLLAQLRYALPIGVSGYMGIIARQIDQYIVSMFFLPKDFAVYSRGAMRIPFLSTIQFTVNDIMMPKYVGAYQNGDIQSFLHTFHLCIEKVAKVNFPVFSFLFAIAPSIVTFLYTEEYLEAASILRVYLCLLLLTIAVYGVIPRASGKTACIMYATMLTIVFNIVLSLLLVSTLGPIGAATATVFSEIVAAVYYLSQSCKILKISFAQIFPWKYLFQLLSASLGASIPVYCINYFFHATGGNLFLLLLVDGIVYVYCWIFLVMRKGLIHQDDIELLQKWLRFDVKRVLYKIAFLRENK